MNITRRQFLSHFKLTAYGVGGGFFIGLGVRKALHDWSPQDSSERPASDMTIEEQRIDRLATDYALASVFAILGGRCGYKISKIFDSLSERIEAQIGKYEKALRAEIERELREECTVVSEPAVSSSFPVHLRL